MPKASKNKLKSLAGPAALWRDMRFAGPIFIVGAAVIAVLGFVLIRGRAAVSRPDIVFTTLGGVNQISLLKADGSVINLSNNSQALDGAPAVSPDGTKIAFGRKTRDTQGSIYVINRD